MGILDDVKKAIDDTLGPPISERPDQSGLGADFSNIESQGLSPESDVPLVGRRSPYDQGSDDGWSIQQTRDNPFTIYDINPFKIRQDNFPLLPPLARIIEKVGYEGDSNPPDQTGTIREDQTQSQNSWRTISIPINANFLKIEFLPAKINTFDNYSIKNIAGNIGVQDGRLINGDESFWPLLDPAFQNFPNSISQYPAAILGARIYKYKTSERFILAQLGSTSGPLILLKDGDVIETQMSDVYFSFKQGCAPFQVIAGSNAKIISQSDNRIMAKDPAFGPGYGLWDNPNRHCTPFVCELNGGLFAKGVGATNVPGAYFGITFTNAYSQVMTDQPLIQNGLNPSTSLNANVITSTEQMGVATGWITGITISMVSANVSWQGYGAFLFGIYMNGSMVQTLAEIPFGISAPSTGGAKYDLPWTPAIPVRFSLPRGSYLGCTAYAQTNQGNQTVAAYLVLHGYAYGLTGPGDGIVFPPNNYIAVKSLKDSTVISPFPLDLSVGT